MENKYNTILIYRVLKVAGIVLILALIFILITNGNETKRMVNVLENRGYEMPKENIIGISETELGTIIFYQRKVGGGATVYGFELLEEVPLGYKWITGGQHSNGNLDKGKKKTSSVQLVERISENIPEGFIFGVTKDKFEHVYLTKGSQHSYTFTDIKVINFGDGYTLWYRILPEKFGENYDLTFTDDKDEVVFRKGKKSLTNKYKVDSEKIKDKDEKLVEKEEELTEGLPPYEKITNDIIESLVYEIALQREKLTRGQDIVVVAPHIFGSFEEEEYLKVFSTILTKTFILEGDTLVADSGSNTPTIIIFKKIDSKSYALDDYMDEKDGSLSESSIKLFTYPYEGIAEEMLNPQDYIEEQQTLMIENIKEYVKANSLDIKYVKFSGKEKIEID